ncbi:MAG TPA: CTP synthase [Alphaproteobacteria bacterium]|nr:CTP synthetase [Rhodospirillaceae bacterium]HRJ12424.1 CTP synthase [Alphaproteobacteria bacterium]
MTRYVFITGGVVSSLGKGIAAAALGALLQARGYKVRLRKLDPYLNVDPGTMSPYQHGEVFVTDDGAETDLDLGHYERFTGVSATRNDSITTGRIYQNVITRERQGGYLGGTVQVIPHITDEIKAFIRSNTGDADFIICEIGGTVGDIEGLPFLEAIRQFGNDMAPRQTMYVHATLLPYITSAGELKTKPTQHSVKELLSVGIQPDLLLCRAEHFIPEEQRRKLALFCNVKPERAVAAYDVKTIYQVPEAYHAEGFDDQVLAHFGMKSKAPNLAAWKNIVKRITEPKFKTRVAVVGKYTSLLDSYKSLIEAFTHAGVANNAKVELDWIDAEDLSPKELTKRLNAANAILVPGGFGIRGTEGKIAAIKYAREKKVPYFGICFGMQMAVLEAAQNLLGLKDASSTEFGPCKNPVVSLMTEWGQGEVKHRRTSKGDLGGTMRLGAYPCALKPKSRAREIYGKANITERHRHRYEVNIGYRKQLEKVGVIFSGLSPDGELPEIIERKDHPWFVGVQFHPELKSRPFDPHPLFVSFIAASLKNKKR